MNWITDNRLRFNETSSPRPIVFRKEFITKKPIVKATLKCTAMGIYYAKMNGARIGDLYLTPGFTSYDSHLQYQVFDIQKLLSSNNTLDIIVSGGWAVGKFGSDKVSKNYCKKLALAYEINIEYEDKTSEVIVSGEDCLVGRNGHLEASIYDGEVFDANIKDFKFVNASPYKLEISPELILGGPYVKKKETFKPIEVTKSQNGYIYDFGQNFAGVIEFKANASKGQKITVYHAEILLDGGLFRSPLRTAEAKIVYTAKKGIQTFEPQMTYMGFRYIEVIGIESENIEIVGHALYSDIEEIGNFNCSNDLLNKLQSTIVWGAKSNFVDIPTDCPQRDERLGWTADTAVFASTACFLFDVHDLYEKWLLSLRDDQGLDGEMVDYAPRVKTFQDRSAPVWSDACSIVPWDSYMAFNDVETLKRQYDSIKKYIAHGRKHLTDFVWDQGFQFGDWCSPQGERPLWKERGKYVGTCYFANTAKIASKMAQILGYPKEQKEYQELFDNICAGYERRFVNKDGSIIEEFQSAYVLPLHFNMLPKYQELFAKHLVRLIKEENYHLSTGFAGTPYLLFALADNGYLDVAYKVLLQETCPSWLYEIKSGATTMWERWDAVRPDGTINQEKNMVSFNHYAYGSVGDFLYKRVAGIEAIEPGYKNSIIAPKIGGGLSHVNASTKTPYGIISSKWEIRNGKFYLEVEVPNNTESTIILPSGKKTIVAGGIYKYEE